MELVKKIFFTLILIGIGVAALTYIFVYHVHGRGVKAQDGWYFDLPGYRQGLRESKLTEKPLLLYLRRQACQRCIAFEKDYLNNPEIKSYLQDYVKVQLNIDVDRDHQRFADRYNLQTYPSIFILYDESNPISTFLVLATQQIWVNNENDNKGNFMHLSETSFRLALERAKIQAKQPPISNTDTSEPST